MDETYTPPQETDEIEDNFSTINDWQAKDAAEKARQFIDAPIVIQNEATPQKKWSRGQKIGATLALAGATTLGVGATAAVIDKVLPGQEIATASTLVQPGEGLEQSVDRDITQLESKKIDPADATQRQDVIYEAVEINSDANGIVQPGQVVSVVAETSPIFGNVTYKATAPYLEPKHPTEDMNSPRQLPPPPTETH